MKFCKEQISKDVFRYIKCEQNYESWIGELNETEAKVQIASLAATVQDRKISSYSQITNMNILREWQNGRESEPYYNNNWGFQMTSLS